MFIFLFDGTLEELKELLQEDIEGLANDHFDVLFVRNLLEERHFEIWKNVCVENDLRMK